MQLPPQPWMTPASRQVLQMLAEAGGEGRFVGGCVRDALLGRAGGDVDIACTLTPERSMAALAGAGIRTIATGLAHGTVTALYRNDGQSEIFEITTLRRDVACDGRRAEVAFTDDWQEDAARRDFTMNALYADAQGRVYDYFGGVEDAQTGRLRFIGNAVQRIREDALRILRFFRFFAHYGQWPMDTQALAACSEHAPLLEQLSGERIRTEMLKLLAAPGVAAVLRVMQESGVLALVRLDMDIAALEQVDNSCLCDTDGKSDALLRLALLLRSASHPAQATETLLQRWKPSNAQKARLRALAGVNLHRWMAALTGAAEQKKQLRRLGAAAFSDRVRLAIAETPVPHAQGTALLHLAQTWQPPVFPVNGHDLLQAGIREGRELGEALRRLEDWWEEHHYQPDKNALLEYARIGAQDSNTQ